MSRFIKRKKMNKTVALIMALALICTCMTGCGTGNAENSQSESGQTSTSRTSTEQISETRMSEAVENSINTDETQTVPNDTVVRIGSMKGATSIGLLYMMEDAEQGRSEGNYEFRMETGADAILPLVAKGELDIALVPANVASVLYGRTEGSISVIDINTLGVLYMVSSDDSIDKITDLKGKTIYLTGKGTTPDYALQYLLGKNGMSADDCILEYKSEPTEIVALLTENPDAIGLLPQPFVTVACMQNEALSIVLDLNEQWNMVQGENGSSMVTGVTVVRKEFMEEHADAVQTFLKEHAESARAVNEDPATGAAYAVKAGIIAREAVAQKAIPACNITCITGAEMKQALSGYLEVLYGLTPESVGGALPGEDFYYVP